MSLHASTEPLIAKYDVAILDLDGVVYRGAHAIPHAVEAIRYARGAGVRVAYVTNNASRTAAEVASQIRGFGLDVDDTDVVTAGEAIAHIVAESVPAGSPVLVVGGPGLTVPLESFGLKCVTSADDRPVAVVQGFHPDVGWRNLAEASYAIQAGAAWFASNADLTVPTDRGTAPGNGSLVAAVRRATGAEPVVAGKPERGLFDETVRRTGASRPLMVGDRLDTDIVGAVNAGIDGLHVLTGISRLGHLVAQPAGKRPQYVARDLRALFLPHPPVTVDGGRVVCDDAVVDLDERGDVRLTRGDPGSLAALRAVVTAAWQGLDQTGQVPRLIGAALEH
ncbi:MAG: HAD-IIA family hydrolase [Aeromicrobium sp.]